MLYEICPISEKICTSCFATNRSECRVRGTSAITYCGDNFKKFQVPPEMGCLSHSNQLPRASDNLLVDIITELRDERRREFIKYLLLNR